MTTELLLSVGALSLLDTLSPATLGVTVYLLLTERDRLITRLWVYLFTVAGFYFLVGAALMLGLDAVLRGVTGIFQNRTVSWVMAVTGSVLFAASFFVPTKKTTEPRRPRSKSLGAMIGLGFTTSLLEVATALPYFAAIGLMTSAQLTPVQWVPVLAAYNVIMVLPPLLLLVARLAFGRMMQRPLEKLRLKIAQSSGSVLSWVLCIAGLILVLNSIDNL
ncbi:Sap, sulfolipid-1-addressing protein [Paenibacillus sp. cl141a]|uniref:GAP family protein n=1 Tax=Paenibacillus sp. cl141a TaxID=1761877 RepID=UPI0008AE81F5|nr:GAP family protein [Paenibacillus sp. cl141a]SEM63621.1 Sap, sulfolipid-1-addressing protein [Paenibacillus sp. cl141a]